MIKTLRILLLSLLVGLSSLTQAQLLRIDTITGIPLNDTAFENVVNYPVGITLFSDSGVMDTIDVFIKAGFNNPSTLYTSDSVDFIAPGGTLTVQGTYHFDAANFDDGDNIVVIWPMARNTPTNPDTIVSMVYFVSVNDIDEYSKTPIRIYPNPSTEYIHLGGIDKIRVKRVRIIDAFGKECYSGIPASGDIRVRHFAAGTYQIVIDKTDGVSITISMVKGE